jgi:pimeloyl-ACP methyl ester carboxylesterase
VLAAGVAAGLTVKRVALGRTRLGGDPEADEPLGELRGEVHPVTADDGVPLHVEVDEIADFARRSAATGETSYADVTVVLSHAYALNLDSWHYQRKALRGAARLVLYDQRGHGRSGRGSPASATIDQLGADLERVIDAVAPDQPLLLVGHSMGGMSVMALAERRPDLFRDRVVGIALLGTSPAKVAEVTLGAPAYTAKVLRRAAPGFVAALGRQHRVVERGRRLSSDLGFLLTKRYSFASDVPPSLVEFTARMLESTPVDVVAEFFPTFTSHDKLGALPALHGVETLVLVGDKDLITPADHSRELVRALPGADLVVLERTGHMLILERHAETNRHLLKLLRRARRALDEARVS